MTVSENEASKPIARDDGQGVNSFVGDGGTGGKVRHLQFRVLLYHRHEKIIWEVEEREKRVNLLKFEFGQILRDKGMNAN